MNNATNINNRIPFFCPVCHSPMRSSLDAAAYERIKVCSACEVYLYDVNREIWKNGWRPSVDEARIYLYARGLPLIDKQRELK